MILTRMDWDGRGPMAHGSRTFDQCSPACIDRQAGYSGSDTCRRIGRDLGGMGRAQLRALCSRI